MIRSTSHALLVSLCVFMGCNIGIDLMALVVFEREMWRPVVLFILGVSVFVGAPMTLIMTLSMMRSTKLTEELQILLNRDRLTDAATRHFFFERMEAEPNARGVVLMIDIDHFKSINDAYGHLAGDSVIRSVAQVLSGVAAPDDIVCRFGGEEFLIFLNARGRDDGLAIAERMRLEVERNTFDIAGKIAGETVTVTVSIGGALKTDAIEINRAIADADAALYRAKAAGRNATLFAPLLESQAA
ncbi:GGDEF domain-containing protein [Flavimaricola marinus]|uniref:diguanylate cyclase n=1 Tax=Flavimaricola marinus TaxID=1819565 RepID=A0A238LGW4_9RHOB|nr:GGDEF domain-containing protein [Flavimaricola marinus]SMY08654.1 putative diguanylate cyclase YcdT [Flavimaricola marinus]